MPVGALMTVPLPFANTLKVYEVGIGIGLKLAVTDFAASIVTVQLVVPVQAPLQPAKL